MGITAKQLPTQDTARRHTDHAQQDTPTSCQSPATGMEGAGGEQSWFTRMPFPAGTSGYEGYVSDPDRHPFDVPSSSGTRSSATWQPLANNGTWGRGMQPTNGATARSPAPTSSVSPSNTSEAAAALATYLAKHPDSKLPQLMQAYGKEQILALCPNPNYRTLHFLSNLDAVSSLITSKSALKKAGRLIADFMDRVKNAEGENYFKDIVSETSVRSLDELSARSRDLSDIILTISHRNTSNPFTMGYHPSYEALRSLFKEYGIAPFGEIARRCGKRTLNALTNDDVQGLLREHGMASIKAIALAAGDQGGDALSALASDAGRNFTARFGFTTLRDLVLLACRNTKGMVPHFITKGLPAASRAMLSKSDFMQIAHSMVRHMQALPEDGQDERFFRFFEQFSTTIDTVEKFERVATRSLQLTQEFKKDAQYLFMAFSTHPPSSIEAFEGNPMPMLKRAFSGNTNSSVRLMLGRAYLRRGKYAEALTCTSKFKSVFGRDVSDYAELRFTCIVEMMIAACTAPNSNSIAVGTDIFMTRDAIRRYAIITLKEIEGVLSGMDIRRKCRLFRQMIEKEPFSFKIVSDRSAGGARYLRFQDAKQMTIVLSPDAKIAIFPENIRIQGNDVVVPKYHGTFPVIFHDAAKTIPSNNEALLWSLEELPGELFRKLIQINFSGQTHVHEDGHYFDNVITVHEGQGQDQRSTIVHELAHHWDLSITGHEGDRHDPSRTFYDISWKGVPERKEIYGGICKEEMLKRPGIRDDFDWDDFSYWYGLCSRMEDLATVTEKYVTKGPTMREHIRKQMANGNFELAAKYLFVRYLMPFNGREYETYESHPLGVTEVEQAYRAAPAGSKNPAIDALVKKVHTVTDGS